MTAAICPHCHAVFPVEGNTITDTTLAIWQAAGPKFWRGKRRTLREIAEDANYSLPTVREHLLRLHAVGLVVIEPLGQPHAGKPRKRRRYAYRGNMFTQAAQLLGSTA